MHSKRKRGVVALIKRSVPEDEYLFIKPVPSDDHGLNKGKYYPPGGHVEGSETEEEALVREIKEELGVEARPVRRVLEIPSDLPGRTLAWWECQILSENFTLQSSEIAEARWFNLGQIKGLELWPATRKFFEEHIFQDG